MLEGIWGIARACGAFGVFRISQVRYVWDTPLYSAYLFKRIPSSASLLLSDRLGAAFFD